MPLDDTEKPPFDPTQPFQAVTPTPAAAEKPPFDPSKPFAPVAAPPQYTRESPLVPRTQDELNGAPPGAWIKGPATDVNPTGLMQKPAASPEKKAAEPVDPNTGVPIEYKGLTPAVQDTGILAAIPAGLVSAGKGVAQTVGLAAGMQPKAQTPDIVAAQPVEWKDLFSPRVLAEKTLYGFAQSAPTMASAMFGAGVGATAGAPAGPVGSTIGGIAGTAAGAALGHTIQSLGMNFGQALQETNGDSEKAWNLALTRTGIGAAGSAAGFSAFSIPPFAGTVKSLLFQAFGLQPGIAVGEKVVGNVAEGKPAMQGALEGVPGAIVGTAAPMAAHVAGANLAERMRGPAAAGPAPGAAPSAAGPAAAGPAPGAAPSAAGPPPTGPTGPVAPPAEGSVVHMPMADGKVTPLTVERVDPDSGIVRLVDPDGMPHPMMAEDIAKFSVPAPEVAPPAEVAPAEAPADTTRAEFAPENEPPVPPGPEAAPVLPPKGDALDDLFAQEAAPAAPARPQETPPANVEQQDASLRDAVAEGRPPAPDAVSDQLAAVQKEITPDQTSVPRGTVAETPAAPPEAAENPFPTASLKELQELATRPGASQAVRDEIARRLAAGRPGSMPPAVPAEPAPIPPGGYRTAKGSVYQQHDDGTTTRNKSFHPEHGAEDQGPQPRSTTTFYVNREDMLGKLAQIQATNPNGRTTIAPVGNGQVGVVYADGPNAGKFIEGTLVTPTRTPAPGLYPVEVFDRDGARSVHFGNEITEVAPPEGGGSDNPPTPAPAPRQQEAPAAPSAPPVIDDSSVFDGGVQETEQPSVAPAEPQTPEGPREITPNERRKFTNPRSVNEAKFLLPDGRMLGSGDEEHQYIAHTLGYGMGEEGVEKFMRATGAIRLNTAANLVDGIGGDVGILSPPTPQQMTRLDAYLKNRGEVDVAYMDQFGRAARGADIARLVRQQEAKAAPAEKPIEDQVQDFIDGKGPLPEVPGPSELINQPEPAVPPTEARPEAPLPNTEEAKPLSVDEQWEQMQRAHAERNAAADAIGQEPGPVVLVRERDPHPPQGAMIHPSTDEPGHWQYTTFDQTGFLGHTTRDTKAEAVRLAMQEGFRDTNRDFLRQVGGTDEFLEGTQRAAEAQKRYAAEVAEKPEAPQAIPARTIREGDDEAFIPSTGASFKVQYAIVDARDLITSHHDDLSPNANYPQALQPRSRERAETEAQISGILNGDPRDPNAKFRPELLGENPDAANGSPVIGPEGYVESGNARTMALKRAYARDLPQAEQYRQYLAAQGYPVEGIRDPVLVRVNRADMEMPQREQLARDLNVAPQAAMSATDRARADAQQIAPETLRLYQKGDIFSAGNQPFVKSILSRIVKPSELPAMTNPEGGLSSAGQTRVKNALLAKAYGDTDIIAALTEDADNNIKSIGNALSDAAPHWAQLRQAVADGRVAPEYDLTSPLLEAVRLISHARDTGRNVAEFMKQRGLFGEGVSPETEGIISWMLGAPEWTRRYGRDKIAAALQEYATAAQRERGFLAQDKPQPTELVERAREQAQGATRDLFAAPVAKRESAEAVREVAGEGRPANEGQGATAPGVAAPAGGAEERTAGVVVPRGTEPRDPSDYLKLGPDISAAEYSQRMTELQRTKPRPVNKLWNKPETAPPERVAAAQEAIKSWNREYARVSKNQKAALERDNEAFRAGQSPQGTLSRLLSDESGALRIWPRSERGDDASDVAERSFIRDALGAIRDGNNWTKAQRILGVAPNSPGVEWHNFNAVNKWLTMPRTKAALDPIFNKAYSAVLAKHRDAAGLVHDYHEGLESWQGQPRSTWNKVFSAMEILTLEGREVPLDGRSVIAINENYPHAALSMVGDTIRLTAPEEIRMFTDYRQTMRRVWKDLVSETARQFGWEGEPTSRAMLEAAKAARDKAERTRLTRAAKTVAAIEYQQRAAYLPLMRSGDYFVQVKPRRPSEEWNGEGFPPTVYFKLVDSEKGMERAMGGMRGGTPSGGEKALAEVREKFPEDDHTIDHGFMFRKTDAVKDLDIPAIDKLMMLVSNDARGQLRERLEGMGMDKEAARSAAQKDYDALVDTVLDQVFSQRVAGFKKRRKGVAGYDGDFAKSTGRYLHWLASHIADMKNRPDLEAGEAAMTKHPDPRSRSYWRDFQRRQEDYGDPLHGPLARMRQGAFYWYLGANAATTAKILMHGPMRGIPVMSTGLNRSQAAGEYLKAGKQLMGALTADTEKGIGVDFARIAGKLSEPERALLEDSERKGILHPQTADELMHARRGGEEVLSEKSRFVRKVFDIWSSNVSAADRMVRGQMLLSAYRTATREGMDRINQVWNKDLNWANTPNKTPEAFAQFMVDQTVGIWGDVNRMPALQTPLGGMMGQFKTYEIGYFSNLNQMLRHMGPEGKVTAALMMGGMGVMGGALGLPFAMTAVNAVDSVWHFLDETAPGLQVSLNHAMNALLGDWGGEAVLHGPARVMTGVDWSGLGFGDALEKNMRSIADIFGPGLSLIPGALANAYHREHTGQGELAAAREMLPNAVKHLLDSMYPEIALTTTSGKSKTLPNEAVEDLGSRVKLGLGFQPAQKTEAYERKSDSMKQYDAYKQAIGVAGDRIANLIGRGEPINDAVKQAQDILQRGMQLGVFSQEEADRFRNEVWRKAQQRLHPEMPGKTQQRIEAVQHAH